MKKLLIILFSFISINSFSQSFICGDGSMWGSGDGYAWIIPAVDSNLLWKREMYNSYLARNSHYSNEFATSFIWPTIDKVFDETYTDKNGNTGYYWNHFRDSTTAGWFYLIKCTGTWYGTTNSRWSLIEANMILWNVFDTLIIDNEFPLNYSGSSNYLVISYYPGFTKKFNEFTSRMTLQNQTNAVSELPKFDVRGRNSGINLTNSAYNGKLSLTNIANQYLYANGSDFTAIDSFRITGTTNVQLNLYGNNFVNQPLYQWSSSATIVQAYNMSMIGTIPSYGSTVTTLSVYDNLFTSFRNLSWISINNNIIRCQNNYFSNSHIDTILYSYDTLFKSKTPIKNLELRLDGGTMGSPYNSAHINAIVDSLGAHGYLGIIITNTPLH